MNDSTKTSSTGLLVGVAVVGFAVLVCLIASLMFAAPMLIELWHESRG